MKRPYNCTGTTSTLNGDTSDKGIQTEGKIVIHDQCEKAAEAKFEDQFRILSRPFKYILNIEQNQKSKSENPTMQYLHQINALLNKHIDNSVWASGLAEEIQYIIICEIKRSYPTSRIRDEILVNSTRHITQVFEQILNLFEFAGNDAKSDIVCLFDLLIENTFRLEGTATPLTHETIKLYDTRRIIEKYRQWIIDIRFNA